MPLVIVLLVFLASGLDSILTRFQPDSLAIPLRRHENLASNSREGAEAAMTLGRLHYARGEYRLAAEAFARAAARLDPSRKYEARYWAGMSWLALEQANQARAAFEEILATSSPRRVDATVGLALAFDLGRHPDRALATLEPLLAEGSGEAMPQALERLFAFAARERRDDLARRARERLIEQYPASMEAQRAALPAPPVGGVSFLVAGPIPNAERAAALLLEAQRAGFGDARVAPGDRAGEFVIELGEYTDPNEARREAERARRVLHLNVQIGAR